MWRFLIDQFFQLFAGLEVRHFLRRHVHFVAGFRVAALARLAAAQAETAEASQLDLLAAMERGDDAAEDRVDDHLGVLLGEIRDPRDFLDELGLRHAPAERRGNSPDRARPYFVLEAGLKASTTYGLSSHVLVVPTFRSAMPSPLAALRLRLEVIAERRFAGAGLLGVLFPVGAELVRLQRADAEADLPFRRARA